MLWDTHMHTQFSGDSTAPVEAMIESAIANRLDGICFTDHMDYDYPNEPDLFVFDIEKYTECMKKYQFAYKDRFPIHIGVELGLQPQIADWNRNFLSQYDFDFIIGSPNRGQTGGLCGHNVHADSVICTEVGHTRSHELHNFILYIAVGKYFTDNG